MNYDHREHKPFCEYHPTEVLVGVCPLCLNERLIILAAKQGGHHHHHHHHHFSRAKSIRNHSFSGDYQKPSSLPKIFDFGSLLNRFEFRHRKSEDHLYTDASTSHEDSFISIKFENNIGVGTWEKSGGGTVSKVSLENCNFSWNHCYNNETKVSTKTVVEHVKPRGSSLRWRKRIGHLFQLSRWKRSNKGSVCHVGSKLAGVKGRNNGWIRSLTKRRTKEY